jgi:hypothetical protein
MSAESNKVKIVAIGDGTVGKTSLLISYSKGEFPDDYVPTVFENYRTQINTSAGSIALDIWDTAGQEEYVNVVTLPSGVGCGEHPVRPVLAPQPPSTLHACASDDCGVSCSTPLCRRWRAALGGTEPQAVVRSATR